MVKSGLIFGAVMLFLGAGAALLMPLCGPCVALILGVAAGYFAGLFDKPTTSNDALQRAAGAGAIAGVGALVGQMAGGALNSLIYDPQTIESLFDSLGLYDSYVYVDSDTFLLYSILIGCCLGIINIALMALFGAFGGFLWFRTSGQKEVDTSGLI